MGRRASAGSDREGFDVGSRAASGGRFLPACLSRGGLSISFVPHGEESGIAIARDASVVATCRRPLGIRLFDSSGDRGCFAAGYAQASVRGSRARAAGSLKAEGVSFEFEDLFEIAPGEARLRRTVRVAGSVEKLGFLSFFDLAPADAGLPDSARSGATVDDLWFIPGLWYGRNEHVPTWAIGAPATRRKASDILFREDRLALPLALRYDERDGSYLSLSHLGATPTTIPEDDNDAPLVDGRLAFGSFGLTDRGACLSFWFPGTEGETLYAPMWCIERGNRQSDSPVNPFAGKHALARTQGWIRRGHPVADRFTHSYTLRIESGSAAGFADAASLAWRRLWSAYHPAVKRAPLRRIEQVSIELLERLLVESGEAAGIPTWIDCFTGKPGKLQNELSIGFVSRNLEVALVLLEAGRRRRFPLLRAKGERVVDFWTARGGTGLSHTEYDYRTGAWADYRSENGEPFVYLRDQSEAHRVCLACCASERRRGVARGAWLTWARSYGDWLLAHQNPDGSFYRSYALSGRPASTSTADSSHVVAFLCDLASATGEGVYLSCALRTAGHLWNAFHREGLYFGGTLDNPDCIDKEASALALDGYLRLYESTRDRQWLEAADRSARWCETWIIAWEIPMPTEPEVPRFYAPGHTTVGLQLITTGFSAVDMFLGRQAGDFLRLARYTGDRHWTEAARILLHNTKCMVQVHGEHGYAHDGFQIEHWAIGRGRGYGLNSGWLPWVSSSHAISIWTRSLRKSRAGIPKRLM